VSGSSPSERDGDRARVSEAARADAGLLAASAPPTEAEVDDPTVPATPAPRSRERAGRGAFFVAAGIFLSRIAGLVRGRVLAHFLGVSDAADAFTVALRAPNILQNLLGEGALSASFIPVYAALVRRGEREEAGRLAGGVGALLALAVALLVLVGVLAAPWLVPLFYPRYGPEKQALVIHLVRILFPGAGVMVMSAWCLGILNSHGKFLLSYSAPVIWNAAIVAAVVASGRGGGSQADIAAAAAWGSVAGSVLQVLVQLPSVLSLVQGLRPAIRAAGPGVRTVAGNFLPAFMSRGVVQISAYFDQIIAGLVSSGAAAALGFAQQIYTLPVSLFGMSISAAELPEMSADAGATSEAALGKLRARLVAGLRRMAYFVVPSAVAFLALGDVIAGALFQTGSFRRDDARFVWAILAGSAVGLLAATMARLYSSTFYALRDTRTPVRFAVARVALSIALGYFAALHLPRILGVDPKWGMGGLALASSVAGWLEYELLRRSLGRRIGGGGLPPGYAATLWGISAAAALAGFGVKQLLPPLHPIIAAAFVLGTFGVVYVVGTVAARLPEADVLVGRVTRRFRRR
jgi:putative peptidoglycan lipid II flippase